MKLDTSRRASWLVAVLLGAVTLAIFRPARAWEFITFDDPGFVTEDELVNHGLTWAGVAWAFSYPLTSPSHLLDVTWFGRHPAVFSAQRFRFHRAGQPCFQSLPPARR